MTKRLISLLLVMVLMAVSILAMVSCGGTDDPPAEECKKHVDADGNEKCDNCGATVENSGTKPPVTTNKWDDVNFYDRKGNKLELTMQLSEYSDDEMTSGAKKYMAGPGKSSSDRVETLVYERNVDAEETLGIHMNYKYVNFGWSKIAGEISLIEKNGKDTFDLYCDMVYDMMGASLTNGTFRNAYRYTLEDEHGFSDDYYQGGYFEFENKYGYLTAYMDDLSLTNDKQFLLASNYFMDVIRALMLLPFNIDIYDDLLGGEGNVKASKLYEMVDNNAWTWDRMIEMSSIFSVGTQENMDSNPLVIAIADGGLSANALLYSTYFEVYHAIEEGDQVIGYQMNDTCQDMFDLFSKVATLVSTNGIYADSRVLTAPESSTGSISGIERANEKFKNGETLFATPSMMGALESEVFQSVGGEGKSGMGVLPLPKLLDDDSPYCTIINGTGRVGALGYTSENGMAMSAYIQYITENSRAVLNEYYDVAMKDKYTGDEGSKRMLDLIYASIGSQQSMILDELILFKDYGTMSAYTWSQIIRSDNFSGHASDISKVYSECLDAKNSMISSTIFREWLASDVITFDD